MPVIHFGFFCGIVRVHANLRRHRVGYDAEEVLRLALAIGVGHRLQAVDVEIEITKSYLPEVISFAIAFDVATSFSALKRSMTALCVPVVPVLLQVIQQAVRPIVQRLHGAELQHGDARDRVGGALPRVREQ